MRSILGIYIVIGVSSNIVALASPLSQVLGTFWTEINSVEQSLRDFETTLEASQSLFELAGSSEALKTQALELAKQLDNGRLYQIQLKLENAKRILTRFTEDGSTATESAWLSFHLLENKMGEVERKWQHIRAHLGIGKEPGCYCGGRVRPGDTEQQIFNGRDTSGPIPWQVAIAYSNGDNDGKPFCGGSLISENFVLTAAHCTKDNPPEAMIVLLGLHHISKMEDAVKVTVAEKIEHPDYKYDGASLDYDFSLLRLTHPVTLSSKVDQVCMSSQTTWNTVKLFTTVHVSGWGVTGDGDQADTLQETLLKLHDCKDGLLINSNTSLCASSVGAKTCKGDSGGPLTVLNKDGTFTLLGVVSLGKTGCQGTGISAFANVTTVLDWVSTRTNICSDIVTSQDHGPQIAKDQDAVCTTTGGKVQNKPCVFPFIYNDIEYNTCTLYQTETGAFWCSTQVDSFGTHVTGNWGDCSPDCPFSPVESVLIMDGLDKYGNLVMDAIGLGNKDVSCAKPVNYPIKATAKSGGVHTGRPFFCGGVDNSISPNKDFDNCYIYNYAKSNWDALPSLSKPLRWASVATISDTSFVHTGGAYKDPLDTVIEPTVLLYDDGKGFVGLPDMPTPLTRHCSVAINSTHFVVIGGHRESTWMNLTKANIENFYIGNVLGLEYTIGHPFDQIRIDPFCGIVKRTNGETELILAGGSQGVNEVDTISSTVIYSLTNNTWRAGPDLPSGMSRGSSIQYGNSFLIVHITGIYLYDIADNDWKNMHQRFPSTYGGQYFRFNAVLVPKNAAKCS